MTPKSITNPATIVSLLVLTACGGGVATMDAPADGWYDFSEWSRCKALERPGYIFEIENAEGMKLWTPCVPAPVELPWDWKSGPQRFRLVIPEQPRHSDPIPLPVNE